MPKKNPPQRRGRRPASSASTTPDIPPHTPPTSPRRTSKLDAASTLPRLLTIDEVADLLRTTRKGVYGLIYRGALPGVVRLPGRLLIDHADLVEWLREKRGLSLPTQGEQR